MNINATLLGQTISFLLFVWFCKKFVWPMMMGPIMERQTKIADGLAAAEKGLKDQEMAADNVEQAIKQAKAEAAEIVAFGVGRLEVEGRSVRACLDAVESLHPGFLAQVIDSARLTVGAHSCGLSAIMSCRPLWCAIPTRPAPVWMLRRLGPLAPCRSITPIRQPD